ncbi:hypothetical protein [Aulosira sp. FACHB-615]|uniref:hypothetical protein n=1 Tax=Aulosira sp. FACHB-615 TaxID=2692777 RepID=UPI00168300A9|nr:hypothetical protein [Aulosira sp. FACHB-615]MBD2490819.1 hypothetical protein [Aulosira sp. FACHB-615]
MIHGVSQEELETPYGQVALNFSLALLNHQYEKAHSYLGSAICDEWTPSLLKETYEGMVDYFEISASAMSIDSVETHLPDNDSDSAMVYVSVIGEVNTEAVIVVVANESGNYLIQKLEWGRP